MNEITRIVESLKSALRPARTPEEKEQQKKAAAASSSFGGAF